MAVFVGLFQRHHGDDHTESRHAEAKGRGRESKGPPILATIIPFGNPAQRLIFLPGRYAVVAIDGRANPDLSPSGMNWESFRRERQHSLTNPVQLGVEIF